MIPFVKSRKFAWERANQFLYLSTLCRCQLEVYLILILRWPPCAIFFIRYRNLLKQRLISLFFPCPMVISSLVNPTGLPDFDRISSSCKNSPSSSIHQAFLQCIVFQWFVDFNLIFFTNLLRWMG